MTEEIVNIHKQLDFYPDSIEIGEAKNRLKIYFNARKREESEVTIANALYLQAFANDASECFRNPSFRPDGHREHLAEIIAKVLDEHKELEGDASK
jgi:hypothetical protein